MIDEIPITKVIDTESLFTGEDAYKLLRCPTCQDNYQHVGEFETVSGNDNYEAKWGGRGDLDLVNVWGECGSEWQICLGFHKGYTAVFVRVLKDCKEPEEPGEAPKGGL